MIIDDPIELSEDQLDGITGGYILDMKGYPMNVPYCVVDDKWGRMLAVVGSKEAAEDLCTRAEGWSSRKYNKQVITIDEYYQVFGKPFHP